MHEVVKRLRIYISQYTENLLHGESNINDDEYTDNITLTSKLNDSISSKKNFDIIINEIIDLIIKNINEGKEPKQHILDYLNKHNVISKEICNLLSNDQNDSDSIFIFGYFNYVGIGTDKNFKKAFNLLCNASKHDHILAQYFLGECYQNGTGTMRNEKLAFEYFERIANKNYAIGQVSVGNCYADGLGVEKDLKKAFDWYEKAVENGNEAAMHNLGLFYLNGNEFIEIDYQKAFELFQKSAEREHLNGMTMLGYCYDYGIGIDIDEQKAFELYQKAANLGNSTAQFNLASMYEKIEKDVDQAIYWYKQSAKQGYENAQNQLEKLRSNSCRIF
jgi:TPR repeat protein